MPTETRLLYILADLAYIAKLNPAKKAHEFLISDFHQLNGQFLDENTLIEKNVLKLVDKLEAGSYHLVLPDFLFTNTMVNVSVKTEEEVKDYLKDKLLPDLKITEEDYYIDTSVLSDYGGVFKVQLTALEKGIILPLVKALKNNKEIKITALSPLSFAAKSLISLEPSVSILQMGEELYLAQHYIGVDQCFNTSIDKASDFAETVKTLKGVEPSLQTLYLLSDSVVDTKIKEVLSETLPVQQLADLSAEEAKIPPHVKKIIEAGAKTFSIPDYLLPQFKIDESYDKELQLEKEDEEIEDSDSNNIPKPAVVGEEEVKKSKEEDEEKTQLEKDELAQNKESEEEMDNKKEEKQEAEEQLDEKAESNLKKEVLPAPKKIDLKEVNQVEVEKEKEKTEEKAPNDSEETEPKRDPGEINLAQFANLAVDPSVLSKKSAKENDSKESKMSNSKPVIKNSSEASGMLKMIMIGFLSFLITVALGIGIGYGILQLSNRQISDSEPSIEDIEIMEEPEPTPEPELVEINKDDYQLLVVNATTKAGYAGNIASELEDAGFTDVAAGNASGEYEEGNYLLLSDLGSEQEASNEALLKEIEEITELNWELSDEIAVEDSDGSYQAVLVLAQ